MGLIVVGINHRGASVEIRERIAYRPTEVGEALTLLREASATREAVVLSTCNRTEFYVVEGESDAVPGMWSALSARLGEDATGYGYVRRDRDGGRRQAV